MKSTKHLLIALIFSVAAISCTKTIGNDQIYLSISSYTFNAEEDSIIIEINSNREWNIDKTPDWISVERLSETEAKIKVSENGSSTSRQETITFIAGTASKEMTVSQSEKTYSGNFTNIRGIVQPVYSIGNKFCAGYINEKNTEGRTVTSPVLINCLTGERTKYEGSRDYLEVRAVSNDGRILALWCKSGIATVLVDGEARQVTIDGNYFGTQIEQISSDGNVMVGYSYDTQKKCYVAVKWTNFEAEILESPEVNYAGAPLAKGCMARGCSADGSVVYGSEWDGQGLVYWRDGKMFYPAKDCATAKEIVVDDNGTLVRGTIICTIKKYAELHSISSNGKYIAGTFNDFIYNGPDVVSTPYNYPAVIDTETNEIHFIKNDAFVDLGGISVNNDGLCFAATPSEGVEKGYVADFRNSSVIPITDYMASKYGIQVSMDRIITRSNDDDNIVSGYWVVSTTLGNQYLTWYYIADQDKVE